MKIIGSILNLVSYGLTFWAGGAFTLAWMLFDRSGGLTPGELTCKVYFLTQEGKTTVEAAFGICVKPMPPDVNWNKYAQIAVLHPLIRQVAAPRRDAELCQLTDRNHHAGGLAGNPW